MQKSEIKTVDTTLETHNPVAHSQPGDRFDKWWLLVVGVIALLTVLALTSPDPYGRILTFVRDGLGTTLKISIVSFLLVLVIGLVGGLGRLSRNPIINGIASLYVEVVRGIPLLVQILTWYFAFPAIVQNIGNRFNIDPLKHFLPDAVTMAIIAVAFCYGAYMSEIYRAGIQSIPKGQMEAARSLGMTYVQAMRYVIIPQAFRMILPPIGNEFISIIKDSSLVSAVAVPDLTLRGRQFMATSMLAIETWVTVGMVYLVLTLFSARIVQWLERKTKLER